MLPPIRSTAGMVAGIPLLHVRPNGVEGPLPTVIFQHGWSSAKDRHLVTAESLACQGFHVILPDALHHGERDRFADHDTALARSHFWRVVADTVEGFSPIYAAAVAEGWSDPNRVGVAGSSMGGMAAAAALAEYPWVKAAVLLNGCPCFGWLAAEWERTYDTRLPQLEQDRLALLDPEARLSQLEPRPLLMLHGTADTTVPIGGVQRFADLAARINPAQAEKTKLVAVERLNHYVTVGMVQEMNHWLTLHL